MHRACSCWDLLSVRFVTWFLLNKTQQNQAAGCQLPASSESKQHSDPAVALWLSPPQKDHLGNWSTFILQGLKANKQVLALQNSSPDDVRTIHGFRTELRHWGGPMSSLTLPTSPPALGSKGKKITREWYMEGMNIHGPSHRCRAVTQCSGLAVLEWQK